MDGQPALTTEHLASPIGTVRIRHDGRALHSLWFLDEGTPDPAPDSAFARAILAYFAGEITALDDLPVVVRGTAFETRVWQTLRQIPVGRTWSYRELAAAIEQPKAVRAVGAANGRNPVSLVLPCHRVIGANGSLTGYGGGLERKAWLLRHEGVLVV